MEKWAGRTVSAALRGAGSRLGGPSSWAGRQQDARGSRTQAHNPSGAIRYILARRTSLTRHLDDGRLEIDTNTVERSMRPIALGRKNHLFAGSDGGGETWAIMASLLQTAKLNGRDFEDDLGDNLESGQSGEKGGDKARGC